MTTAVDAVTMPRLSTSAQFVASAGAATVAMGERLALYEALARLGSASGVDLAAATCLPVWLTEGWLVAQAAGGYLYFDRRDSRYRLWCDLPLAA